MLVPEPWREIPPVESITLPERAQAANYVIQAGWDLTYRAKGIGDPNVTAAEAEQLARDIEGVAAMLRRFAARLPTDQVVDVEAHEQ